MTLNPIGDIANPLLTGEQPEKIVWETATDWDSAVAEDGVVHEGFGDHIDDVVELGYPSFDRGGSALKTYYPTDEDSGTTANDVTGNGNDGTYNGSITLGSDGILNTTDPTYDGSNDYVDLPNLGLGSGDFTIHQIVKTTESGTTMRSLGRYDGSADILYLGVNGNDDSPTFRVGHAGGSETNIRQTGNTLNDGGWHTIAGRVDFSAGDANLWLDGSQIGNGSGFSDFSDATTPAIGRRNGDNIEYWNGQIAETRIYTRYLSDSELVALDGALSSGSLTSATKTTGSTQPDLIDLSYTLNGETLSIDVIGSPGTASEEVVNSGNLDGTQTSASLPWSSTHNDFRVKPILSTNDPSASPTVSRVALQ